MQNDELIARLEAATGPCRELDAAIAEAIGHTVKYDKDHPRDTTPYYQPVPDYSWQPVPTYSASIDAALPLVPEGWHLASLGFIHPDFRQVAEREWQADIFGPVTWTETYDFPEPEYEAVGGNAPTPALAICIAALKARSHD